MTNFVFISPEFPKTYYNFCDRLKKNGITVLGISSTPYDQLRPELKSCLTEYYKVNDMNNYDEFVKANNPTAKSLKLFFIIYILSII